jgi:Ala-tRNA(Pro) deacylase
MPKTFEELIQYLDNLDIEVTTIRHAPVFTVAEAQDLRGQVAGAHTKNLFLKDKKDNFFLVTVDEEAEVDLKTIHTKIGAASRVSFGKPEKLLEYLGLVPGAVSLFGAINDTQHQVKVVLDESLMERDIINAHPLTNEATTSIGRDDLVTFLKATGHEPLILKIDGSTPN